MGSIQDNVYFKTTLIDLHHPVDDPGLLQFPDMQTSLHRKFLRVPKDAGWDEVSRHPENPHKAMFNHDDVQGSSRESVMSELGVHLYDAIRILKDPNAKEILKLDTGLFDIFAVCRKEIYSFNLDRGMIANIEMFCSFIKTISNIR